MEAVFTYEEFTTRNIGFVSEAEQKILKNLRVFVPGVGGMGGTAVACLARAGVENFIIADIDYFEISNLNRQVFSSMNVIGKDKATVTKEVLESINPQIKAELRNKNWVNELDEILKKTDIVINGCDDIKSTIQLMRKCREYKLPAIDAFASPLPNVYVIRPDDQRPEEVFGFPTVNLPMDKITKEIEGQCLLKEVEHIAVYSSSLNYVDLKIAKEIMNGTRKRISFSPMVWTTGCMMAYEVVRLALNKKGGPGVKGMFFNPWTCNIEKPQGWLTSSIRRFFVKRFLSKI
ncbi:MAG: ThiF family adenylyltransferase [Bacteroidia bacterium]